MEFYPWLKAGHIFAWTIWLATLLIVPLAARAVMTSDRAKNVRDLAPLRRIYSGLGTPSMLTAISLGLVLAQQSSFFTSTWLQLKLALVLTLAGLHGVTAGLLRRAADAPAARPEVFLRLSVAICTAFLIIVLLAVVKPGL